jgi:ribosomal protein S12 methylthiotransferase accessory factor
MSSTQPVLFRGRALQARKQFLRGTHRSATPDETFERVRHHLATIGVTRLANIGGLDRAGLPVFLGIRPNSPTLSNSSGKGLTPSAARVSAVMEAIETYHAENVQLPTLTRSYAELTDQVEVVAANYLPMVRNGFFNSHWPLHWTMGWDIVHQQEIAVPLSSVALRVRVEPHLDRLALHGDTNGLASGNNMVEAVSVGLLELIERDGFACLWGVLERTGRTPPHLDLGAIPFVTVRELIERLRQAEIEPVLYDCTTDILVPVYAAVVFETHQRHVGIARGAGAHLDPEIAMLRALTEAVQSRVVYTAGSRDDLLRRGLLSLHLHDDHKMIDLLLRGGECAPSLRPSAATATFEDDVHVLVERLQAVGLDRIIVFDLTHPGFEIAVVRVIVPGLEGYLSDEYTPGARASAFLEQHRT